MGDKKILFGVVPTILGVAGIVLTATEILPVTGLPLAITAYVGFGVLTCIGGGVTYRGAVASIRNSASNKKPASKNTETYEDKEVKYELLTITTQNKSTTLKASLKTVEIDNPADSASYQAPGGPNHEFKVPVNTTNVTPKIDRSQSPSPSRKFSITSITPTSLELDDFHKRNDMTVSSDEAEDPPQEYEQSDRQRLHF